VAAPPPPSVRVRTETLDRFLGAVGEVILSSSQLRTAADAISQTAELGVGLDNMERKVGELQRRVLELRTTPLLRVMERLPRAARQVAEAAGKRVEVEVAGAELELDRSILDRLTEPLLHLVRNAVDHGIEAPELRRSRGKSEVGRLAVRARRRKDAIVIEVADDGGGIDLEAVRRRAVDAGLVHPDLAEDLPEDELAALIFRPGISTAAGVSEVSGRGVGMDAVRTTVESLGGAVELRSELGAGTTTTLLVPITAAVQRVLLVEVGGERVALPISKLERLLELEPTAIERTGQEAFAVIEHEPTLVLDLAGPLALPPAREEGPVVFLALVEVRGQRVALRVDRFLGQEEIYLKPVPDLLQGMRALAGLTVLGDGRPVFLVDPNHLA